MSFSTDLEHVLLPGDYDVQAIDNVGCVSVRKLSTIPRVKGILKSHLTSLFIIIIHLYLAVAIGHTSFPQTCVGVQDGRIELEATGGNGQYEFGVCYFLFVCLFLIMGKLCI